MAIGMTKIDRDMIFTESHFIFRCCYVQVTESVLMLFVSIYPWY